MNSILSIKIFIFSERTIVRSINTKQTKRRLELVKALLQNKIPVKNEIFTKTNHNTRYSNYFYNH